MSDIETMTRAESEAFFRKFYAPSNLTIAIVGDVNPVQIQSWAETYFGRIPSGQSQTRWRQWSHLKRARAA